ncbi:MAG TPA: ABC transporter ATP-binding protein [Verrucomicrobiota bacterium]|nr:ABC transporter ATP-binding protein [Verrucomicrobiota bacterium]
MGNYKIVFQFGLHYLRPYWVRLSMGLFLGVLFGMTNASFIGAVKTITDRFQPPKSAVAGSTNAAPASGAVVSKRSVKDGRALSEIKERLHHFQQRAMTAIDPWLPRAGTPLNWRHVMGVLLFLPLLVFVRSGLDYGSSYCLGWVSERVINDMRMDVMQKFSSLSLDFFNRVKTGDLLTRINADTIKLQSFLKNGTGDIVKESVSVIAIIFFLIWLNWKLTFFALVFLPACLIPLVVLSRKVRRAARASVKAEVSQSSQLVELISGIRIIKAYCLEVQQVTRYRKMARELVRQGMKGVRSRELINPLIELISMVGVGGLILYIFKTQTSIGEFVGFLYGVMAMFVSVKKLARVHVHSQQAGVGVERLAEIMREQPTVKEPASPKVLKEFRSEIRFDNVSFGYVPDRMVITDFNLVVSRGMKVGVAGPSGSGKSTLVNLLYRFYDPARGAISIDGLPVREMSFENLRGLMALVSQDIVIFDLTVAENIALGKPTATRGEIEAAAREANAHEFIMRLPEGYDTRVGERGATMSGGQRQRLSIARAFVRNAPILVLDEATASLDSAAEAEVQRAIDHLAENRTVISIAHRLSTLSKCDHILVMTEGLVVEQGGFEELLRQGGVFSAMAARQGLIATATRTSGTY